MLLKLLFIASTLSATVSALAFNVNATSSSAPLGTGTATATANLTGATICTYTEPTGTSLNSGHSHQGYGAIRWLEVLAIET